MLNTFADGDQRYAQPISAMLTFKTADLIITDQLKSLKRLIRPVTVDLNGQLNALFDRSNRDLKPVAKIFVSDNRSQQRFQ